MSGLGPAAFLCFSSSGSCGRHGRARPASQLRDERVCQGKRTSRHAQEGKYQEQGRELDGGTPRLTKEHAFTSTCFRQHRITLHAEHAYRR